MGAAVVVFTTIASCSWEEWPNSDENWSAGWVDYSDDVRVAAPRELLEETGLVADIGRVVFATSGFRDPAKLTVGISFSGSVVGGTLGAGDDADDVGWFKLDGLPPLAFRTDEMFLRSLS